MRYINEFSRRCVRGTSLTLLCSFLASGSILAAPSSDDANDQPPPSVPADVGLTRDSLEDLSSPPQPPAASAEKAATATRTTLDRAGAKPLARHRHRRRHSKPAQEPPQVVIHPQPHRNPVVRFVYWWNGLVIRKLHTHIGTVMLGTVGAKT